MIVDNGKYYLYRHIRLDKNEPFYIGVGKKGKQDLMYGTYTRANDKTKKGRNNIWHGIVSRTAYQVEILLESDDYTFISAKEAEFVNLYGRIIFNNGSLANIVSGGGNTEGFRHSEESKKKMSLNSMGKKVSKEQIEKFKQTRKERPYNHSRETALKISIAAKERWKKNPPVFQKKTIEKYSISGTFLKAYSSWEEVVKEDRFIGTSIKGACRGSRNHFYKGFFWFYKDDFVSERLFIKPSLYKSIRPIEQIDIINGKTVKVFNSIQEAGHSINNKTTTATGCIRAVCTGTKRQKTAYGYKWRYLNINQ